MAANNVTIYNFLAWIREQIEPDRLSALITGYNYTDDSDQTILEALQRYPEFRNDLGRLLGRSIKENTAELNRSVGGISFESTSLSLKDWQKIAKSGLNRADGIGNTSTPKQAFDWNGLVQGVLGAAAAIFGGVKTANNQPGTVNEVQSPSTGSSTAMWIIIGVVVIAIVAILWLSLSKK